MLGPILGFRLGRNDQEDPGPQGEDRRSRKSFEFEVLPLYVNLKISKKNQFIFENQNFKFSGQIYVPKNDRKECQQIIDHDSLGHTCPRKIK